MATSAPSGATSVVASLAGISKRYVVRRPMRDMVLHPRRREWSYVLRDIACEVRAGEFFGLLGPNGAGKTTLLKILATLVLPDEGQAHVSGFNVASEGAQVRAVVSPCLASERSLYWRLTARENLQLAADLQGVPRDQVAARSDDVLGAVGLMDTGTKMVGQFSSGMMQRLLIARALLSRPALLLLDEPTRSLDPLSAREFRRFLREELVQRRGCAVLLATHSADEAFELCDRVAVMHRGRLLAQGPAAQLSDRYLGARYRIVTSAPVHPAMTTLCEGPNAEIQVLSTVVVEGEVTVTVRLTGGDGRSADVLASLVHAGMPVARFERLPLVLADLIEGVMVAQGGQASGALT
ncbi:MAG: ABC transporter ATP-binding protein [Gemmatimonadaceae bacterium]